MSAKKRKRAFAFGAYFQSGGTHMIYKLAEILHEDFDYDITVVRTEYPKKGFFKYKYKFPVVSAEEFEKSITDCCIDFLEWPGLWTGIRVD